jgi:tetratricopeptide (TPR) repeat protein
MYSSSLGQTATETSDLSVASVRKALAGEHASIAAHPKNPTDYVNLAYTLTDAGIGEQARTAAVDTTRVAPTSALAFSAQGWVLHHSNIGVDYGSGFDYDGALRAYRKAIELDPHDLDVRQSLANLLEFNPEGVRYAPDAQLPLAIDAYRYVKQHQPVLQADVVDNLAIDLFYAGRYDDAIQELIGLPGTAEHLGIMLASVAACKGSPASIALSNRIEGDEQRRKDALNFAAEGLWNKRLYAQVADLLTASLPDTAKGTAIAAKIQLFRNLKPFTAVNLPASEPWQRHAP